MTTTELMSPGARMLDERIRARGMDFRVLSDGRGSGIRDVYVLVHGLGTSHRYLGRLHAELAKSADVYSVDVPGFGGLARPGFSPSVPLVADGLARVLDSLGLTRVILVGHSMGAQWAVELACARPDLARAVVAMGPVVDDHRQSFLAQSAMLARDIVGEPPLTNAVVFIDYLRCGTVWFLRQSRRMLSYRIEDGVAALIQPFLVLRGGNDPIATLSWCRRLRDRAARGSLVIVPGHRHVVQFTAPIAVAAAIRAFVLRNGAVGSATGNR